MLNDKRHERDEFDSGLQDEDIFDANPPPGTELVGMQLQPDCGSGSYAEDGSQEILEDRIMANDADLVGSAAMYGPTEIGEGLYSQEGASEIGEGWYPGDGASEIGAYADQGASEIGGYAEDGASEVGAYADQGASEIGAQCLDSDVLGGGYYPQEGASEIGKAVVKVVEKARDNRQPAPPMKAVDPESPLPFDDWGLADVVLGAAQASGHPDPFPLTTRFMQRCGAGMEPRFVRVDTDASYKQFRTDSSPELAELRARFEEHVSDPYAHERTDDALSEAVDEIVHIGEEAMEAEQDKVLELRMPQHFDGLVTAWREDDMVGCSMRLPDGRVATTFEPVSKSVAEMSRHASEADVSPSAIVGVLTAMGCVLGAGTALKEMAAGAPAVAQKKGAPFVVRLEPKVAPALCALAMLAMACREGVQQAIAEWANLASLSPGPVKQAMLEAVQLAKAAE
jgi:hypothetical protein